MKKVLFISYFSPPFDDLESRMVKNLASRLPESGWNTVVVSSKYAFNCPKSSEPAERTGLRVVSSGVKKEGFLLRALYSLRFVPDPQIGWFWFSRRAAECELKNGTDVIISRSNPITSHLVALALKKRIQEFPGSLFSVIHGRRIRTLNSGSVSPEGFSSGLRGRYFPSQTPSL